MTSVLDKEAYTKTDSSCVPIVIPDERQLLKKDESTVFLYPPEYEGNLEGVLIASHEILERTSSLARKIREDYRCKRPMMICVLKGAGVFYYNLLAALQQEQQGFTCEFIRAKSYERTNSTGNVEVSGLDLKATKDKDVIIVEDIIDTGATVSRLISLFEAEECRSIEVCTLLEKRIPGGAPHQTKVRSRYSGFSIGNKFIVGHGLDYNEQYRDMSDIWVLSEKGMKGGMV